MKEFILMCIYPKYFDKYAWANNLDPDQMTQNATSVTLAALFRHMIRLSKELVQGLGQV